MPYKDPTKQKQAQHNHYLLHKRKYRKASLQSKLRRYVWFYNIKATFKCKKCGEKRIPCLDFHHRAPSKKERSVANMVCNSSKARILKEIKKCDVLCKNCHAILHSKDVRNKFIIAL